MLRMCSLVADLPMMGQRLRMLSARAILTYWKVSLTRMERQGMILLMMSLAVRDWEKLLSLEMAAVRTSLSVSERKLVYWVRSLL